MMLHLLEEYRNNQYQEKDSILLSEEQQREFIEDYPDPNDPKERDQAQKLMADLEVLAKESPETLLHYATTYATTGHQIIEATITFTSGETETFLIDLNGEQFGPAFDRIRLIESSKAAQEGILKYTTTPPEERDIQATFLFPADYIELQYRRVADHINQQRHSYN